MSSTDQDKKRNAGYWEAYCMGMGIQFGGAIGGWNLVFAGGFWQGFVSVFIIGTLYTMLSFAFAEITSIVAFAGGSFGYCRCTLGPYYGYLIGSSEILQNIFYVVATAQVFGAIITTAFETPDRYNPLWYLLFYATLLIVHLNGGRWYWNTIIATGGITFIVILLYCIGEMVEFNFERYALDTNYPSGFTGGGSKFMQYLQAPTWYFIGIELVPLTCDRIRNVSTTLPKALWTISLTSFVVALWVTLASCTSAPGLSLELIEAYFPLTYGYQQIYRIPMRYGALLAIPPVLSAGSGFMYGCGHQVLAMARSGILPSIFTKTYGVNEVPYVCYILSFLAQYALILIVFYVQPLPLSIVCVIGASCVYIGVFSCYIAFRTKFEGMKREFYSPFGIPGAVLGIAIASLLLISVLFFQVDYVALSIYLIYMLLMVMYYFCYATKHQFFSAEEQQKFMKAYILNANKKKKNASRLQKLYNHIISMLRIDIILNGGTTKHDAKLQKKDTEKSTNKGINVANRNSVRVKNNRVEDFDDHVESQHDDHVAPCASEASTTSTEVAGTRKSMMIPANLLPSAIQTIEEAAPTTNSSDAIRNRTPTQYPGKSPAGVVGRSPFGGSNSAGGKSPRSPRSPRAGGNTPRLNWSGKVMSVMDSKKFFELLQANDDGEIVEEKLAEALPELFALRDVVEGEEGNDEENQAVGKKAEQGRVASPVVRK